MRKIFTCLVSTAIIFSSCSSTTPSTSLDHEALRVAIVEDPITLDPRLSRDLAGSTIIRTLYEGLTRVNNEGKIIPAAAESIDVSEDGLTYTFHLRNANWSDNTPVTAEDFAATWKSALNPAFPSPNAYQLFVIKGAREAKEGKTSLDTVAVIAIDNNTLVVNLEQPTPHFLELLSCTFFYPVSKNLRENNHANEDTCIGNGPFCLKKWERRSEFNLVKNPLYWDAEHVALPAISFYTLDEHTALVLFHAKGLDWVGSPLTTLPQDSIASLKAQGQLEVAQGAGTHWFRLNTEKSPFTSTKMRRAFGMALDRNSIVEHVTQGNQKAALSIVPPAMDWLTDSQLTDNNVSKAQELFNEALSDLGITKNNLPKITLSYSAGDRNHKVAQAVQQQWNKAFGLNIALESSEAQVLRERTTSGNYQIALGSWYADYRDPINFLEIFKYRSNATNQTFWENSVYTDLLEKSAKINDPLKRKKLLAESELILIDEMPVLPLFFSSYNYLKTPGIEGVYFSPLGYLDFKEAYFTDGPGTGI